MNSRPIESVPVVGFEPTLYVSRVSLRLSFSLRCTLISLATDVDTIVIKSNDVKDRLVRLVRR